MKTVKLLALIAVLSFFSVLAVSAQPGSPAVPLRGEEMVRRIFADLKAGNIEAVARYMAPGFQAVRESGTNDRDQEIANLRQGDLGDYTLSDFKATRTGPVMIVTYTFSETKAIFSAIEHVTSPAPRMSVFLIEGDGWQWLANADLRVRPYR